MTLKEFIDNHPLGVIAALTVAVAATATGVVEFFASERLLLQEDRHRAQLTQLTGQYDAKIEDFSRRLASIERRVGEDRKYFDVTNVMLSRDEIPTLSSNHEAYIKGYLYASPPDENKWAHSITNELEIGKKMFPLLADIMPQEIVDSLASWETHIWQYADAAEVACKFKLPLGECSLYFYPYIYALRVTRDMISQRGESVLAFLENKKQQERVSTETLLSAISNLNNESDQEQKDSNIKQEKKFLTISNTC